jgi:CPSF A subunit region/Mono-functional DNA-alkylating methyl methanesulfonate N-term
LKNDLRTISLHCYDTDETLTRGRTKFFTKPEIVVDPSQRCGALIVFDRNLVIVPFQQQRSMAMDQGSGLDQGSRARRRRPIGDSYVVSLDSLHVRNVKAMTFLNGYFEPTLLVLQEPFQTWAGRAALDSRTCVLTAISLNLEQRTHTIIWKVAHLPFDCEQLVPLGAPMNGALVLSPNAVLYFQSPTVRYARSLNSMAPDLRAYLDRSRQHEIRVEEEEERAKREEHERNERQRRLDLIQRQKEAAAAGDASAAAVVASAEAREKERAIEAAMAAIASSSFVKPRSRPALTESSSSAGGDGLGNEGDDGDGEYSGSGEPLMEGDYVCEKPSRQLDEELLEVRLDAARWSFLSRNRIMVSTLDGDLYLLHVLTDGRSAQDMSIAVERAGSAVISSCMCTLTERYLFMGSRIGDSLLIRYADKTRYSKRALQRAKRQRTEAAVKAAGALPGDQAEADAAATGGGDDDLFTLLSRELGLGERIGSGAARFDEFDEEEDDDDEEEEDDDDDDDDDDNQDGKSMSLFDAIEGDSDDETIAELMNIYGKDITAIEDVNPDDEAGGAGAQGGSAAIDNPRLYRRRTMVFSVADTLLNIGPIRDLVVTDAHRDTSHWLAGIRKPIELLSASGHLKNGALCVVRQLRPQLAFAFDLANTQALWALNAPHPRGVEPTLPVDVVVEEEEQEQQVIDDDDDDKKDEVVDEFDEVDDVEDLEDLDDDEDMVDEKQKEEVSDSPVVDDGADGDEATSRGHVNGDDDDDDDDDDDEEENSDEWTTVTDTDEFEANAEWYDTDEETGVPQTHGYLVISRDDKTVVLETGRELNEVSDRVDFVTDERTLDMGNVLGGKLMVQVVAGGALLLDRGELLQRLECGPSRRIVRSFVSDPFVAALCSDGTLMLLMAHADTRQLQALANEYHVPVAPPGAAGAVADVCVYRDGASVGGVKPLYPLAPPSVPSSNLNSTQYLVVARAKGQLELYRLPDVSPVLVVSATLLLDAPWLLIGQQAPGGVVSLSAQDRASSSSSASSSASSSTSASSSASSSAAPSSSTTLTSLSSVSIAEVAMYRLGSEGSMPHLFVLLSSGELLIYRAFHRGGGMRFSKERLFYFAHSPSSLASLAAPAPGANQRRRQLVPWFDQRKPTASLFVCGARPAFVFCTRDSVKIMPLAGNVPVHHFAPFHNINCQHGFGMLAHGGLRFCNLNASMSLDADWPARKLPLRSSDPKARRPTTAHYITYVPDGQLIALVVSQRYQVDEGDEEDNDDGDDNGDDNDDDSANASQKDDDDDDNDDDQEGEAESSWKLPVKKRKLKPAGNVERYELRLLNSSTWEVLDRYAFDEREQVLSLQWVRMKTNMREMDPRRWSSYLAVGTGYFHGEDAIARGRVLLFDVLQSSFGFLRTNKPKLNMLYDKEWRGPVSALTQMRGYLTIGAGSKMLMFWYDPEIGELVGCAFFDIQMYVVSLRVCGSYMVAADGHKGVYFMHWNEKDKSLVMLAKSYQPMHAFGAEMFVSGADLSMIATDDLDNLHVLEYAPLALDSDGGQRLSHAANFHMGARIGQFVRLPLVRKNKRDQRRFDPLEDVRTVSFFGTGDGALGYVAPLDESVYRRFAMLAKKLQTAIPHHAGLNAKDWRRYRQHRRVPYKNLPNVIDGQLIEWFPMLPKRQQHAIARGIGSTVDKILTNLYDIDNSFSFF